ESDSKDLQQQSKALDKLTDHVEDRQLDSSRVQSAMAALASSKEADWNAMRLREKELAAVKINPTDVEIIANELESWTRRSQRGRSESTRATLLPQSGSCFADFDTCRLLACK
uniref:Uncharacterized protein n=1 Tax=Aegilops tauschii subsp. strangulata TaxID=200361 RepID=A0A453MCJ9_AEGTS